MGSGWTEAGGSRGCCAVFSVVVTAGVAEPGSLSKQAVKNCGCVTGIVPAHVAVLEHHKLGEK